MHEGALVGQDIAIQFICENGKMIIPLADSLGAPNISLIISEKKRVGRYDNMSDFVCNLNQYVNVKIETQNKDLTVFINEKPIYQEAYKQDLGDLFGIKVSFLGSGSIDYMELTNQNNSTVYKETFEQIINN